MSDIIYLAGPISGLTWDEACKRRSALHTTLENCGWNVLNPMRGKQDLKDQGPICSTAGAGPFMPQAIFRRDLNDIERADVVLFDVRGAKDKSLGSIFELGYAYARGKYIILLTDGERGNPHEHLFVDCAVDIQFADEEQLLDYLTEMGGYW